MTDYTAADIHIASDTEILDRWDWAKAGHWARIHGVPVEWLERALEACRRANVDPEYIEKRYLLNEAVPLHPGVNEAMRQLRDELLQQQVMPVSGR